jgi:hypothetical protein
MQIAYPIANKGTKLITGSSNVEVESVIVLIDLRGRASRLQSGGSRDTGLVPLSQGDVDELAETNHGAYCRSTGTQT